MSDKNADKLILASSSLIRQQILGKVGVEFEVIPSGLDEDAILQKERCLKSFDELAMSLAREKCLKVSKAFPGRVVLGADQILRHKQELLRKPENMEMVQKRLERLRNSAHVLYSAVAICREGRILWEHCESCLLIMRNFSDDVLHEYLSSGGRNLLKSVGAYRLEDSGICLFEHIEGDYFAALGLPLLPLLVALRNLGIMER